MNTAEILHLMGITLWQPRVKASEPMVEKQQIGFISLLSSGSLDVQTQNLLNAIAKACGIEPTAHWITHNGEIIKEEVAFQKHGIVVVFGDDIVVNDAFSNFFKDWYWVKTKTPAHLNKHPLDKKILWQELQKRLEKR